MNPGLSLAKPPALIADAGDAAGWRYLEFFTANIRNPHTRRAYARACAKFFAWCEDRGLALATIRPVHVAAWVEGQQAMHSAPVVKQQLAAVRMLFNWLVTGQVVPMNPAAAVHEALARANFEQDLAALTDTSAAAQRLIVHARSFPIIDATILHRRDLRLRLDAANWDEQPPAVALLNPDGSHWTAALPGGVFNGSPHPATGRFFICMRGVREFHTHPSHVNESWDNYRGQDGMSLVGILMQLTHAWRQAA